MASRLFVAASSNRIATTSTNAFSTVHTQVALVTCASIPGAGVYHTIFSLNSGTAARVCALQLNGDSSGTLCALVGATRVNPSSNMVMSTDGRWYLVGAAKLTGTVAVNFFMYDFLTGTWTELASSGTVANRTAAAVSPNIGSNGAANYYDGRIGMVLHIPAALSSAYWRQLVQGRMAMRGFAWSVLAAQGMVGRCFADLTAGGAIYDQCNLGYAFGTGSIPAIDGASTPPGC